MGETHGLSIKICTKQILAAFGSVYGGVGRFIAGLTSEPELRPVAICYRCFTSCFFWTHIVTCVEQYETRQNPVICSSLDEGCGEPG